MFVCLFFFLSKLGYVFTLRRRLSLKRGTGNRRIGESGNRGIGESGNRGIGESGNGESGNGNRERQWGMGNGERGIFKMGNI